jgi:hypothetical protein
MSGQSGEQAIEKNLSPGLRRMFRQSLVSQIGEISERNFSAGWLTDIEHDLWDAISHGSDSYADCVFPHEFDILRDCSNGLGEWVQFKYSTIPEPMPLSEWLPIHAEWRAKQARIKAARQPDPIKRDLPYESSCQYRAERMVLYPDRNERPEVFQSILAAVFDLGYSREQIPDMIRERAEIGKAQYGTFLFPFDGRDSKVDLVQELIDGLVYSAKIEMEREGKGTGA